MSNHTSSNLAFLTQFTHARRFISELSEMLELNKDTPILKLVEQVSRETEKRMVVMPSLSGKTIIHPSWVDIVTTRDGSTMKEYYNPNYPKSVVRNVICVILATRIFHHSRVRWDNTLCDLMVDNDVYNPNTTHFYAVFEWIIRPEIDGERTIRLMSDYRSDSHLICGRIVKDACNIALAKYGTSTPPFILQ